MVRSFSRNFRQRAARLTAFRSPKGAGRMHAVLVFIIAEIRSRRQQIALIFRKDSKNRRRVAHPPPIKSKKRSHRVRAAAAARINCNPFFAAACTSQKTLCAKRASAQRNWPRQTRRLMSGQCRRPAKLAEARSEAFFHQSVRAQPAHFDEGYMMPVASLLRAMAAFRRRAG